MSSTQTQFSSVWYTGAELSTIVGPVIAKVANIASAIDERKEKGIWTFAAEADGDDIYGTDFNCPAAIVLGSEGIGVSRLVREKCDYSVSIPMHGNVNSLNVSTAAAVLLFEAVHNRNG